MDIIAHLPVTQRNCDAIAMFVDCMCRYIYSVPCKSTISAEKLTQLFIAPVVAWYGMVCLSGSYLTAMAGSLVTFGSLS